MSTAITVLMQQNLKRRPAAMEMVLAPPAQTMPAITPQPDPHNLWAAAKAPNEQRCTPS